MSKYFPYSSPIHRPMTEYSTGLPVSEPSLSTSSRRELLTRSTPRPYSSTGLYSPLFRERDLQFEQEPPIEHYPTRRHSHQARLSPWSSDHSAYEEENLFNISELSTPRFSNRNQLRHPSPYSTEALASALPQDPYMIDHLPPSIHPSEHHLSHRSQRYMETAARYVHSRPHDHYTGRNIPIDYALKPYQDINSVEGDIYSSSRRAIPSPDPYGIEEPIASGNSGTEFLPDISPYERLDHVPRTVQGSQAPQQDLQQLMIGEEEDPTNPENWPDTKDNDIVKRAKAMYTMAYSMYQFTRGEGELKTTQDLFTQAEFLTEEANKFYKVVRQFTYQIPSGQMKKDLLDHLNNVPTFVQQLQFSVKNSTVGKAATFTKVDNIIQETKDLMNFISKTVNSCLACASMYNLDMVSRTRSRTLSPTGRGGSYDYDDDRMGSRGAGGSSSDASL